MIFARRRSPVWRVWITRAQPEASATAERVRELGFEPVVEPVLEVQPVAEPVDFEGVGALAFTSRNGVRALAALSPERGLPVFTVGDATAAAAREAGFAEVVSASGDVAALAELIGRRREGLAGEVLYLAPEEPARDLAQALADRGVPARSQAIYRTVALDVGTAPQVDAVLFHSAKAAAGLAGSLDSMLLASAMAAICLSPAVAAALGDLSFGEVLVAPSPNEDALLQALDAWAARQAPRRLFTPAFWIAIGFGLVCILAAILIATLGPRLFPPRVH